MKIKEFLVGLGNKVKLTDEQKEVLNQLDVDVEINEGVVSAITAGLLTMDSAKNNKDLQEHFANKVKGDIFNTFDEIISGFSDKLPKEAIEAMKADDISVPKKAKIALKALTEMEPTKVKDETAAAQIEQLNNQIKDLKSAHKVELETANKKSAEQQVKFVLKNKIFQNQLADNIPGGKDWAASAIVSQMADEYTLLPNDKGGVDLKQKDDPSLDVFDANNEKMDVDRALKTKLEPFLKKGEPQPDPTEVERRRRIETKDSKVMTAQEMIRNNARSTAI